MSNDILEEVFQELHLTVVNTINASSVIDRLFSAKVISRADMNDLDHINNSLEKCRQLLNILHNRKHPRAFIELRQAIHEEVTVKWLVEEIDEKFQLLASASAAQPQVARDRSNTPLTSLDDIAQLNLVIDDLRRDVATLKIKNSELAISRIYVATLKRENSRLMEENATLTLENIKLAEEKARLKDENNRLCLERSSAEDEKRKMVKTIEDLNNKLQRVPISRSESYT